MYLYTVEPLYNGHIGSTILVLITEVSSKQRSFNTLQCYTGTQNGVLIMEVSTFQRFVIERFQCIGVHILGNFKHEQSIVRLGIHRYLRL